MRHKISKWQVIGLYGLVIGLLALIYYVGQRQTYRGRAAFDVAKSFTVTSNDPNNPKVECSGTACTTDSDDVTVQFNEGQVQELLNSLQ